MIQFATSSALILVLCLGLSACGGAAKIDKSNAMHNPYIARNKVDTQNGMTAMQRQRWLSAEQSFARALQAAQLSNDMPQIIGAWYNLASAQAAMGNFTRAETAFRRCIQLSERYHDTRMHMRSRLALALMHLKAGILSKPATIEAWPHSLFEDGAWPADIHLLAARLLQLQQQPDNAASAYQAVIATHGNSRALLSMRAEAHMGLALIAQAGGRDKIAWRQAEQTLAICHRIGMPLLTAHALLLQGRLNSAVADDNNKRRMEKLERALAIYTALNDLNGQKESLMLLQKLAEAASSRIGSPR